MLLLAALIAASWTFERPVEAVAATAPPNTHSYYVMDPSAPTMNSLGATEGKFDTSLCQKVTVILDFGQVGYQATSPGFHGYGTYDFQSGSPFIKDGTIETAAENLALGWYGVTGSCPHLMLGVGVNNYNECPFANGCSVSQAGTEWASLIAMLRTDLTNLGVSSQITVRAAMDAQAGWDCFTRTNTFLTAFNNRDPSGAALLDFGDAAYASVCNQGTPQWTQQDVWEAAYGQPNDFPFPEIYVSGQITDWKNVYLDVGYMNSYGTLSQYPCGGYSPSQAWTNFYDALKPVDGSLVLESSLDVIWQDHEC